MDIAKGFTRPNVFYVIDLDGFSMANEVKKERRRGTSNSRFGGILRVLAFLGSL